MTAPLRANPDWYPDPLGRGEYRYWDGNQWTQWIANAGTSRIDTSDLPGELPEPSQLLLSAGPHGGQLAPPGRFAPPRFRPLTGLSTALQWLLAALIVNVVVLAAVCLNRISKLDTFEQRADLASFRDLNSADDLVGAVEGVLTALSIAALVVFIVYLYRASTNTALWNTGRRTWGPGWTIGAWFIPLGNLVLVPLVVNEIWRRTPEGAPGRPATERQPSVLTVVCWWVLFVVGSVAARVDVDPDTFDEFRAQDWTHIVGCGLLVVAAVLLMWIVRSLTRRQVTLAAGSSSSD